MKNIIHIGFDGYTKLSLKIEKYKYKTYNTDQVNKMSWTEKGVGYSFLGLYISFGKNTRPKYGKE